MHTKKSAFCTDIHFFLSVLYFVPHFFTIFVDELKILTANRGNTPSALLASVNIRAGSIPIFNTYHP